MDVGVDDEGAMWDRCVFIKTPNQWDSPSIVKSYKIDNEWIYIYDLNVGHPVIEKFVEGKYTEMYPFALFRKVKNYCTSYVIDVLRANDFQKLLLIDRLTVNHPGNYSYQKERAKYWEEIKEIDSVPNLEHECITHTSLDFQLSHTDSSPLIISNIYTNGSTK